MKKLVLIFVFVATAFTYQDGWQSLDSSSERDVTREIVIVDSTHIIYEYTIHGFSLESITKNSTEFYSVTIPGSNSSSDSTGLPKLPSLSDILPSPECTQINVTVSYADEHVYNSLLVYPVPDIVFDSLMGYNEVFTMDTNYYLGTSEFPSEEFDTSNGSFRDSSKCLWF